MLCLVLTVSTSAFCQSNLTGISRSRLLAERFHVAAKLPHVELGTHAISIVVITDGAKVQTVVSCSSDLNVAEVRQAVQEWASRSAPSGSVHNEPDGITIVVNSGTKDALDGRAVLDLTALQNALGSANTLIQTVVAAAPSSSVNLTISPKAKDLDGRRFWVLSSNDPAFRQLLVTSNTSSTNAALALVWLIAPVIGLALTSFLCWRSLRDNTVPLNERRRRHFKILGLYLDLLSLPFAMISIVALESHYFDSAIEVISGLQAPDLLLICGVYLFSAYIWHILALKPAFRDSFGPTRDERREAKDSLPANFAITETSERRPFTLIASSVILGVTLFAVIFGQLEPDLVQVFVTLIGFEIVMVSISVAEFTNPLAGKFTTTEVSRNETVHRVSQLLERNCKEIGIAQPILRISPVRNTGRMFANARNKRVNISLYLASLLSDREMNCLLVHELAHLKLSHIKFRTHTARGFFAIILTLFALSVCPDRSTSHFVSMILLFSATWRIFVILIRRRYRIQEFEADLFAARLTGDPAGCAQMLQTLRIHSEFPGIHESDCLTHPPIQQRIDRLIALAKNPAAVTPAESV